MDFIPFHEIFLIEQRRFSDEKKVFPLVLTPNNNEESSLFHWLSNHQNELDQLILKHHGILFRGFPELSTHQDFHDFVISTGLASMPYLGGAAVRTQLTERVFTANESPSTEKIPFHHELAQTPEPPTHIMFFCESPPNIGGQTPILLSNEIYSRLKEIHPVTMEKIERLGVQYIRVMPKEDDPSSAIGRGWKSTFLCDNKGENYRNSFSEQ
jgi:alpha-ketoglutarate-dependent taurine dioxygenase